MSDIFEVEINGIKYSCTRIIHGKTQTLYYETEKLIDPETHDSKETMDLNATSLCKQLIHQYLKNIKK